MIDIELSGAVKIDTPCDAVLISRGDFKDKLLYKEEALYPLSHGKGTYEIKCVKETKNGYSTIECASVYVDDPQAFTSLPNVYVNSEHAAVKALVDQLTKGLQKPMDKIRALYNYVHNRIKYDYMKRFFTKSMYIPDYDRIMKHKMGLCWDKACLLVALLRAAGLKAIVRVGELEVAPNLVESHSWCMVEVDGKWRSLDPTNGSDYAASKYKCDRQY